MNNIRAIILQQNIINAANTKKCDKSYTTIWKSYKNWVAVQVNENALPEPPPYITRDLVDLWFAKIVAVKTCTHDHARKHVSALQYFANREPSEYAGAETPFIIDSSSVKQALDRQKQHRIEARASDEHDDPHNNLATDVLDYEEEIKLINTALSRQSWADFMIAWTGGVNFFLRGHSVRQTNYCHLVTLTTHGPPIPGEHDADRTDRMLAVILRDSEHKKKESSRVAGSWRHRSWKKCFSGMVAMRCMVELNCVGDEEFNFYCRKNNNSAWQAKKIFHGTAMMHIKNTSRGSMKIVLCIGRRKLMCESKALIVSISREHLGRQ